MVARPWLAARRPPSCSCTLLFSRTGEENKMKKLLGQNKDKLVIYPLLSQAKQTGLGEIKLSQIKIDLYGEKQRQIKKIVSPKQRRSEGNGVSP